MNYFYKNNNKKINNATLTRITTYEFNEDSDQGQRSMGKIDFSIDQDMHPYAYLVAKEICKYLNIDILQNQQISVGNPTF